MRLLQRTHWPNGQRSGMAGCWPMVALVSSSKMSNTKSSSGTKRFLRRPCSRPACMHALRNRLEIKCRWAANSPWLAQYPPKKERKKQTALTCAWDRPAAMSVHWTDFPLPEKSFSSLGLQRPNNQRQSHSHLKSTTHRCNLEARKNVTQPASQLVIKLVAGRMDF